MALSETLPALTAIVAIPDQYATVAQTIEYLKKQTIVSEIQIVLVVPSRVAVPIPLTDLEMFHDVRVTKLPNLTYSHAMAHGIRHADAPVVAMTEDHAFPAPNWAERLVSAHQAPHAVVGPMMRNANPTSAVSWADFYIGYGKWAEPIASGEHDFLMAHNAAYKRDVLLEFGAALEEMMASETALHFELAHRKHTFWLEATTHTAHVNFDRWQPFIAAMFFSGRVFAGYRAWNWSWRKRALYALAFPLIALVRLVRIRRDVRRAAMPFRARLALYGAIALGLFADALGQGIGYAMGRRHWDLHSEKFEFHRAETLKRKLSSLTE